MESFETETDQHGIPSIGLDWCVETLLYLWYSLKPFRSALRSIEPFVGDPLAPWQTVNACNDPCPLGLRIPTAAAACYPPASNDSLVTPPFLIESLW